MTSVLNSSAMSAHGNHNSNRLRTIKLRSSHRDAKSSHPRGSKLLDHRTASSVHATAMAVSNFMIKRPSDNDYIPDSSGSLRLDLPAYIPQPLKQPRGRQRNRSALMEKTNIMNTTTDPKSKKGQSNMTNPSNSCRFKLPSHQLLHMLSNNTSANNGSSTSTASSLNTANDVKWTESQCRYTYVKNLLLQDDGKSLGGGHVGQEERGGNGHTSTSSTDIASSVVRRSKGLRPHSSKPGDGSVRVFGGVKRKGSGGGVCTSMHEDNGAAVLKSIGRVDRFLSPTGGNGRRRHSSIGRNQKVDRSLDYIDHQAILANRSRGNSSGMRYPFIEGQKFSASGKPTVETIKVGNDGICGIVSMTSGNEEGEEESLKAMMICKRETMPTEIEPELTEGTLHTVGNEIITDLMSVETQESSTSKVSKSANISRRNSIKGMNKSVDNEHGSRSVNSHLGLHNLRMTLNFDNQIKTLYSKRVHLGKREGVKSRPVLVFNFEGVLGDFYKPNLWKDASGGMYIRPDTVKALHGLQPRYQMVLMTALNKQRLIKLVEYLNKNKVYFDAIYRQRSSHPMSLAENKTAEKEAKFSQADLISSSSSSSSSTASKKPSKLRPIQDYSQITHDFVDEEDTLDHSAAKILVISPLSLDMSELKTRNENNSLAEWVNTVRGYHFFATSTPISFAHQILTPACLLVPDPKAQPNQNAISMHIICSAIENISMASCNQTFEIAKSKVQNDFSTGIKNYWHTCFAECQKSALTSLSVFKTALYVEEFLGKIDRQTENKNVPSSVFDFVEGDQGNAADSTSMRDYSHENRFFVLKKKTANSALRPYVYIQEDQSRTKTNILAYVAKCKK